MVKTPITYTFFFSEASFIFFSSSFHFFFRSIIVVLQCGGGTIFPFFTRMSSARYAPSNSNFTGTKRNKFVDCSSSSLLTEQHEECPSVFQHTYLSLKASKQLLPKPACFTRKGVDEQRLLF